MKTYRNITVSISMRFSTMKRFVNSAFQNIMRRVDSMEKTPLFLLFHLHFTILTISSYYITHFPSQYSPLTISFHNTHHSLFTTLTTPFHHTHHSLSPHSPLPLTTLTTPSHHTHHSLSLHSPLPLTTLTIPSHNTHHSLFTTLTTPFHHTHHSLSPHSPLPLTTLTTPSHHSLSPHSPLPFTLQHADHPLSYIPSFSSYIFINSAQTILF